MFIHNDSRALYVWNIYCNHQNFLGEQRWVRKKYLGGKNTKISAWSMQTFAIFLICWNYFGLILTHQNTEIFFGENAPITLWCRHCNFFFLFLPPPFFLSPFFFASGPTGTDACIGLESRLITAIWMNDTRWTKQYSIPTQWSMLSYSSVTLAYYTVTRDPVTTDTKFSWLPFPKPPWHNISRIIKSA